MSEYFLTADLHLGHRNIIRFSDRSFAKTIEEHDELLINNWNETVSPKDIVILIGDFCFDDGKDKTIEYYVKKLNGHIIFVEGNHDPTARNYYKMKNNSGEWVYTKKTHDHRGRPNPHLFMQYHPSGLAEIKINKEKYVCCHYPLLTWNRRVHGAYCFFGHIHLGPNCTTLDAEIPVQPYSWDVGVDNNNYKPIHLDEAKLKARTHELWKKTLTSSHQCIRIGAIAEKNLRRFSKLNENNYFKTRNNF